LRNEEGFARYVTQAYPGLVRRAVLLTGDRALAEDLVQVSLASTYRRWRRVEHPDAYVRIVMIRTVIGWRARRWTGEMPTDPLPDQGDPRDPFDDADLSVVVRRALMTLPAEQRAVIVLRYFDDCSEADIAEVLGCSVGTVKSRAWRAITSLRTSGLLAEAEEGQIR
jgi:RNA polymerase sigma-70 factor (sigma-E family)